MVWTPHSELTISRNIKRRHIVSGPVVLEKSKLPWIRQQTAREECARCQMLFLMFRCPDVDRTTDASLIVFRQNERLRPDLFALLGFLVLSARIAPFRNMPE